MYVPICIKSIISDFAWGCKDFQTIKFDISLLITIDKLDLNPLLFKSIVWSTNDGTICTPLIEFHPLDDIQGYGFTFLDRSISEWAFLNGPRSGIEALFEWSLIDQVLHRLDFRKANVKQFGSRALWDRRFETNTLTSMQMFDTFLIFALTNQRQLIKKRYRYEGLL